MALVYIDIGLGKLKKHFILVSTDMWKVLYKNAILMDFHVFGKLVLTRIWT